MLILQPRSDSKRHLAVAVLASVGLHAVLLALVFWHRPPVLLGVPSGVDGPGMDAGAVYVSIAKRAQPTLESDVQAKTVVAVSRSADDALKPSDGGSPPAIAQDKAQGSMSSSLSVPEEARDASSSASQPATPSSTPTDVLAVAGDPTGDQTLLQQIAKCFPAGTMPSLPTVHLEIQVDGEGNLAATPVTDIDLGQSSPDDIRAANTIIQATLLCGPYVVPPAAQGRASVLAIFSQTPPGTQAAVIPANSSGSF